MTQDEFNRNTLKTLHDMHNLLRRLANREYCNRALLLALAEQAPRPEKLGEDFEGNMLRIWEQVPPEEQDAEIYRTAQAELRDRQTPSAD